VSVLVRVLLKLGVAVRVAVGVAVSVSVEVGVAVRVAVRLGVLVGVPQAAGSVSMMTETLFVSAYQKPPWLTATFLVQEIWTLLVSLRYESKLANDE
jgi:tryptophan-rich sensory protein